MITMVTVATVVTVVTGDRGGDPDGAGRGPGVLARPAPGCPRGREGLPGTGRGRRQSHLQVRARFTHFPPFMLVVS